MPHVKQNSASVWMTLTSSIFSKAGANHLLQAICQYYKYTTDWNGNNYRGLVFAWNYTAGFVDISMSGYIQKTL